MYHQLSLIIVPLLVLYRQYVHGYAWTSELLWVNWLCIILFTTALALLTKKDKYMVFTVSTCAWVLTSAVNTYFVVVPIALMMYVYKQSSVVYVLYPILSLFNPVAALLAAIVQTVLSKGEKVYVIALACLGFLYTIPTTVPPVNIPAIYYVIGTLSFTTLLLTDLKKFSLASTALIIGIVGKNYLVLYATLLYGIAWYLKHLANQRWSMTELKQISITAIVTMILFSTIVTSTNIIDSEPHESTLQALAQVNDTIIILDTHELSAKISGTPYILAEDLVIPRTERVQQLRKDGFLKNNVYTVPYTNIIVDTMQQNGAPYILYQKGTYENGIGRAVQSEAFKLVHYNNEVEVYTYAD